jgi:translation initiation factor IF-1
VDMDITVVGHMSGKMKLNKITVMEWDYVKIELSEYDMSQGRIVYRFKDPQQAIASTTTSS